MAKITDIKPQTKNKSRANIFVDGEYFCALEKLTVLEHRLKVGDEIDGDKLRAAIADSERTAAFDRAAKYVGLRPRTEKEMREYLTEKGYDEDTVDYVVEKLKSYGYIDDAEFCRVYIDYVSSRYGKRKIEADLKAKGVSREIIDAALEEADDQSEAVARLSEKYLRTHPPDMRKLIAYLMSKGFDYETIKKGTANIDLGGDDD